MSNQNSAFITSDPKMGKVIKVAENVANSKASVLITGESGTGKELLARYIHSKSSRANKKLVAVNCAAVPGGLMESELFGHEKGAFTGAHQRKIGKFELASGGTLLLDEIGEMPLDLQPKLLRALQEQEIERVGGTVSLPVNVRVIAATNKNLKEMVEKGEFREDLFYRLNVIPMHIPALRDRARDLALLAHHFVEVSCVMNGLPMKKLSDEALKKIMGWTWPGNIRELNNVIERATLLGEGEIIVPDDIEIQESENSNESLPFTPGMTVQEAEKYLILKTLEFTEENRTQAAKILGISIRTLRNKLNAYKREACYE